MKKRERNSIKNRKEQVKMDFSEKWGKDVDEAVRLALLELKLSIDEVDVTVLEESSKGFFGLGSKLAKVRVEKKKPDRKPDPTGSETGKKEIKEVIEVKENRDNKESKEKEKEKEKEKAAQRQKKPKKTIDTGRPADLVETDDHPAVAFVKELALNMNLTIDIKAAKNDESIYIDIEGKDAGTIIGKRGQTLDAIQYLASLVANKDKDKEKYTRVVIDAESYRSKREKTLELLAERLAGKVIRTRRSVRLEPMNPYERKIIHAKLQGNLKVVTRSEGEEPYRRVVIELK